VPYDCFTDTEPADYDESDSGFHLTDADYGLEIIDRCEVDGWTLLTNAREEAIDQFKSDLSASLLNEYDKSISPYSGLIGKLKHTGIQNVTKAFVGHSYKPRRLKGAKWVIKKFHAALSASGTFNVHVASNDPTFTTITQALALTANQFTAIAPSSGTIELPFYSIYEDEELEYFITLERASAYPRNNSIACSTCGGAPNYPKYMEVNGIQADDTIGTGYSYSSFAHGLAIEGYLSCDALGWLCELDELNGFEVKSVLARCIQQLGAAKAIEKLVHKQVVNLCTLYSLDQLMAKQNFLNQRYANNVLWLVQNMPKTANSCFTCKPENTYRKVNLLV
jgi:hypothetical protein